MDDFDPFLLQYCDRGSMEKACEQNRFMNKLDNKPDMVPSFPLAALSVLQCLYTHLEA